MGKCCDKSDFYRSVGLSFIPENDSNMSTHRVGVECDMEPIFPTPCVSMWVVIGPVLGVSPVSLSLSLEERHPTEKLEGRS